MVSCKHCAAIMREEATQRATQCCTQRLQRAARSFGDAVQRQCQPEAHLSSHSLPPHFRCELTWMLTCSCRPAGQASTTNQRDGANARQHAGDVPTLHHVCIATTTCGMPATHTQDVPSAACQVSSVVDSTAGCSPVWRTHTHPANRPTAAHQAEPTPRSASHFPETLRPTRLRQTRPLAATSRLPPLWPWPWPWPAQRPSPPWP
jgi:hypothetical protein